MRKKLVEIFSRSFDAASALFSLRRFCTREKVTSTMAGTRTRFRQQNVVQTNNQPLYSCWAYFLAPDEAKKRLIVPCHPAEFDLITRKTINNNTMVQSRHHTPISTTKTLITRQSNVIIVSITFLLIYLCVFDSKDLVSGLLLRSCRPVVIQHNKKRPAKKGAENRDS